MTKAKMFDWLVENLHKIEVNSDIAYCEEQDCPALSFRSLIVNDYRPWSKKSQSQKRIIEAIEKEIKK